ncbi:MAG: glycosyltransferase family 4 protein [Candidatus Thermoplasmatota archaeon]|nr:glycosyltransferase family 4 protein [Candidatus Thermoplasmatota archaeon]
MRKLESADMASGIVVFDLSVASNSPAGSCVLAEVEGLRSQYPVTIFSDHFDGADAEGKSWVRVPLPQRPIFIRYWLFQVLAPLRYLVWRSSNSRPAIIQTTQGQFLWGDVAYAHFCHGAYLKGQWRQSTVTGLRRVLRHINHGYNAIMERLAFRRVRKIVVPSLGLQRELTREYPEVADKIVVISNPVDLERFARPADFDRAGMRAELGYGSGDVVFVFVALGDFARKGLGLILPALAGLAAEQLDRARLLVVGGGDGEIEQYRRQAESLGVLDKLRFVGLQKDVRPYLWASDVLAFPSAYEIFSLAILQAAAAGLPPIVSEGLYGAEEFVEHGVNGWVVTRDEAGVRTALADAIAHIERLPVMSRAAQTAVQQYSQSAFVFKWNDLYAGLMGGASRTR